MNVATVPYDWLKTIPRDLLKLDEVPLLGYAPLFPWEKLAQNLAQVFENHSIQIEPLENEWKSAESLWEGFANPIPLTIVISPLEGQLAWIMEEADIAFIMSTFLTKPGNELPDEIDKDLKIGFYHFLAAEVIHQFQKLYPDKNLVPHIKSENYIPQEASLCRDVKISLEGRTIWGRMILSIPFRSAWKTHYSERKLGLPLDKTLAEKVQVTLHLQAGTISLPANEWLQVHPGDFIIVDDCSIEPKEGGNVVLTVNGEPLFYAHLKNGTLEIDEKPSYQKVYAHMEKQSQEDIDPEEDLHSDFEEDEFEDEDTEIEDIEDEDNEESEFEEQEIDEGEETTLRDLLKKPEESEIETPEEPEPEQVLEKEKKMALTPEEIPITIVIEAGRIQMSIQKLLDLQPGNLLELNIKPEDSVNLVANGKCIGKGELLRIGDTLGVRILDLI